MCVVRVKRVRVKAESRSVMAKKKRRRNKSKNQHQDHENFDEEENQPLPKGTGIINDYVLRLLQHLRIRIKRTRFKDYGYQCAECDWVTKKIGLNGRNAVRAHLKKHKNERRAQNHLRLCAWAGAILLLLIVLMAAWSFISPEIPDIPPRWLTSSTWVGVGLLGSSVISSLALGVFQGAYSADPIRVWRFAYVSAVVLGGVVLAVEVLLVSGLIPIQVPIPWLFSGVLPVWMLVATRGDIGRAKLRLSRRDRCSARYVRRFIAKTADGDEEFDEMQLKILWMIRSKQYAPKYTILWQRKALQTMGVKVPKRKHKK